MFPILFRLDGFTVYGYGFFLILGTVVAGTLAVLKIRKKGLGISFERVADLFFYSVLSAMVGSRALFVLINFDLYRQDPLRMFNIWEGGLVFYGGLLLAVSVSILYMRRHRLPVWKILDLTSPFVALGLFFGRIGCYSAGCCYGKETSLPWGVTFTDQNSLARLGVSLHPTQLYEALMGLAIFLYLIWKEKRKAFDGQISLLFLLLYSTGRFFIEMLRGDPRGFLIEGLISTSQAIAIILAIPSAFMLFYLNKPR
ncbi:MAG: prolipoprotein diacylglyceryl transferase [Syntrophaceae bacterium]|nr:prolipoprotein diacylglyceryl transferase [Syntrophaceae bacterium]